MEQKNLEQQADTLLNDDALDAVSGGIGGSDFDISYCAICGRSHMLRKARGGSLTVRGRIYNNVEVYDCGNRGSIFYKATDPITGEIVYFDYKKNRIIA